MIEHRTTDAHARGARFPPRSLRTKLLFFTAALVLLPGALLALIAERSGTDSLERVIGRQLAREAGHTAERLSTSLRVERDALASFARQDLMREIRVADIDKRVSMALSTLRSGGAARVDYWVVGPGGAVVASSDPARIGAPPAFPGGDGSTAEVRLLGPVPASGSGGFRLAMTTEVRDPDDGGRVLGTLVGLFDWELLTAATESVRRDLAAQGLSAEILVTGADGSLLGDARSDTTPGELSGVAPSTRRSRPDYIVDARETLIIGRASLAPDLPDWRLLVVESRDEALAPVRRARRRLALAMGATLVAALLLATLGARRVVRPLSELTAAIRGLSHGDAAGRSVPVRSDDEVGTLAEAFNEMASELDRVQRDLVEAEKFAFVGELAAGVAHEIRTALNVLGSSAQILERSLPPDAGPEALELAEMIRAEVGRLAGVVNDLLTLARGRSLELEALPLSEPVFRAADFVAAQAREKEIRIERRAPAREPLVRGDRESLYQSAVNLLANAIFALPRGGRIDVRILEPEDGRGGFEVCDDGPGIPDHLHERIFQPFVSARTGGVGLGLTFVKRVVHEHKGTLSLRSEPGAGARFRILIPLAEATA